MADSGHQPLTIAVIAAACLSFITVAFFNFAGSYNELKWGKLVHVPDSLSVDKYNMLHRPLFRVFFQKAIFLWNLWLVCRS